MKLCKRFNPYVLIIAFTILSGCFYNQESALTHYYIYIQDWQQRIEREGWSKNTVDGIVDTYLAKWKLTAPHYKDHWPTPKDAIESGFVGNCTARASGLYGTLRELDCPYPIGIEVLGALTDYHACLVVNFGKGWHRYETIPGWNMLDQIFYKRLFIFDEYKIYL